MSNEAKSQLFPGNLPIHFYLAPYQKRSRKKYPNISTQKKVKTTENNPKNKLKKTTKKVENKTGGP